MSDSKMTGKRGTLTHAVQASIATSQGIKIDLPDDATPLQVFAGVFIEELWLPLVTETNSYAKQNRSDSPSSSEWRPVTVKEIKAFIGLCVTMGILQLPGKRQSHVKEQICNGGI